AILLLGKPQTDRVRTDSTGTTSAGRSAYNSYLLVTAFDSRTTSESSGRCYRPLRAVTAKRIWHTVRVFNRSDARIRRGSGWTHWVRNSVVNRHWRRVHTHAHER